VSSARTEPSDFLLPECASRSYPPKSPFSVREGIQMGQYENKLRLVWDKQSLREEKEKARVAEKFVT